MKSELLLLFALFCGVGTEASVRRRSATGAYGTGSDETTTAVCDLWCLHLSFSHLSFFPLLKFFSLNCNFIAAEDAGDFGWTNY